MSKRQYDDAAMKAALSEIRQHGSQLRATAKKYGVPKSTLSFKLKNVGHKDTFGPRPILSGEEENLLAKWVEELARKGFPRKKEDLQSSVQVFLNNNPRPNPFKNNKPGDGWVKSFLKRHPEIVQRTSEAVTFASSCVSEKDIRKWYHEISQYLTENDLQAVIQDPSRVFNGDETGFQLCPSTGKVLACKGEKNVYTVEHGSSKENITVMFTFSASGKSCPPMIIYGYKRIPEKIASNVPTGWGIAKSENGWMTSEVFFEYIANIFHPYLIKENIVLPVVFFLDGHKTHLTYEVSKLCSELKIELVALYPNATRILQPADVAVFRPIKLAWKKAIRAWCNENVNEVVTKLNFASILENVVNTAINPETLVNGFRVCGLCPFNVENIDFSKCLGKQKVAECNNQDLTARSTITYEHFKNIVGEEKIGEFRKFEELSLSEENRKDFCLLYKIWKSFQNSNESEDQNQSQVIITQNQSYENTQEVNTPEEIQVESNREIINQTLSEASPSFKIVDNTAFGKYLVWPKTPERKGKRETERLPFAITSEKYKQMFREKKEKKRKIEEEKAEKKRIREENKKGGGQKTNKKRKNIPEASTSKCTSNVSEINLDKIQTATRSLFADSDCCGSCKQRVHAQKDLVCDECSKIFHKKCVPKSHQIHIPDDMDNDLYLCHLCYRESYNSSEDENVENSDEDTEDVNILLAEYKHYYNTH